MCLGSDGDQELRKVANQNVRVTNRCGGQSQQSKVFRDTAWSCQICQPPSTGSLENS
jgi:hypothetical protein